MHDLLRLRNYHERIATIDTNDLLDSHEVAALLGLSSRGGVAVYQRRYPDFPPPAVQKARCLLWNRADVEAWTRRRP